MDADLIRTLKQLTEMAKNREIAGISAAAFGTKGELHLIIAGEPYDNPIRAAGAINRLKTMIDHFPEHPVLKDR